MAMGLVLWAMWHEVDKSWVATWNPYGKDDVSRRMKNEWPIKLCHVALKWKHVSKPC